MKDSRTEPEIGTVPVPEFVNLEVVAALLGSIAGGCEVRLVEWLLAENPWTRPLMAELRQLAADAAVTDSPIWADKGLWYRDQLDRLLAAGEGWQIPDEVLDPDDGCKASVLFKVLDARLARGEGERADLLLVREKLDRARAEEERVEAAAADRAAKREAELRAWIRANADQLTHCSIMAKRLREPVSAAAELLPILELLARLPG